MIIYIYIYDPHIINYLVGRLEHLYIHVLGMSWSQVPKWDFSEGRAQPPGAIWHRWNWSHHVVPRWAEAAEPRWAQSFALFFKGVEDSSWWSELKFKLKLKATPCGFTSQTKCCLAILNLINGRSEDDPIQWRCLRTICLAIFWGEIPGNLGLKK